MSSEEKQFLSENSDEDDLPDLESGISSTTTNQKFEPAQHDIVWAEFRKLHWPALVRCVKKKEKVASIWYLDSPRRCFKVPFYKIKSFSDPQMTQLVKMNVQDSPMKDKHKRVWLNAITYIRRRTQGYKDDPASYFDLQGHYLAYQGKKFDNHFSGKVENSVRALETDEETHLNAENDFTALQKEDKTSLSAENNDPTSSDDESLVGDEDEGNVIDKKLSSFIDFNESYEDEPEVENIVKCIAAGHVDKHLLQVKSKRVPSQYQELYDDAMCTNRAKLLHITPPDNVKSTKKLREISIYLMNYYEKAIEGGKCEMIDYVMYVWLPEAITKAVELISSGSLDLTKAIPESRRRLFPTDELVGQENCDSLSLLPVIRENKGKKRGRPKGATKKQTKKSKTASNDFEFQIKSTSEKEVLSTSKLSAENGSKSKEFLIEKEVESTSELSLDNGSKSTLKSPGKKGRKLSKESLSKEEVKMSKMNGSKEPQSLSKKESKLFKKCPSKKDESKKLLKSPKKKEIKLPTRISPRKKVL